MDNQENQRKRGLLENIRVLALAAVEKPNYDYLIRKIQRVFSTTFYVPLPDTEDLDVGYMAQHIYENLYENMTVQERAKAAEVLLKFEEMIEEEDDRADEDDVWAAQIEEELRKEQEKEKAKQEAKRKEAEAKLPPSVNLKFEEDS